MPKLVRDLIPDLLHSNGQKAQFYTASDAEYSKCLLNKLVEEVQEYLDSESIEELVDILEVIDALIDFKGHSKAEIESLRQNKVFKKGAFKKRIIMS